MKKFLTHVFRPGTGRTVPSAAVQVKAFPSTEASGNATVYSDSVGTTPITQPFLSNANGMVEFFAPDNVYDLYFSIPDPVYGTISYKWSEISIDGTDTVVSLISGIQNGEFVLTENNTNFPNRVVIPTFKGHPDKPPTVAGGIDNEFNSADGAWSVYAGDGNTTQSLLNGRLRLQQITTQRTAPAVGFERNFANPAGDFTLVSLLRFGYHAGMVGSEVSGERPMWGMGIRTSLGEIVTIGLRAGAQGISVFRADYSSVALVSTIPCQQIGSNACYVRIRRVGTTLYFEWSTDGFTYVTVDQVAQSTVMAGSFSKVGLYAYASFDTGGFIDCFADFIRQS